MGLFGDIYGAGKTVGGRMRAAGEYVGERAARPAGKGIWRGVREYDERVLDPLGAAAIQNLSELNRQTLVLDFKRLIQGKQPFVHGRRTFFDEEITPRRIDYGEIAFGSGVSRRREQEKARATFEEAGPIGEILAKSAVDPLNIFVVKSGVVVPTYRGAQALVRGGRRLLPGAKAAVSARAELEAEYRALKTAAQAAPAPEQEARLYELRQQLAAAPEAAPRGPLPATGQPFSEDLYRAVPAGGRLAEKRTGTFWSNDPRITPEGIQEGVRRMRGRVTLQNPKVVEGNQPHYLRELAEAGDAEAAALVAEGATPGKYGPTWWRKADEFLARRARGAGYDGIIYDTGPLGTGPPGRPRRLEVHDLTGGPPRAGEPVVGLGIDPVTGIQSSMEQVPGNPGAAATRLSTLDETVPNLTELAQTIMGEQARETAILSSRLARPFRFVTNRFWGTANTAKAEALDSRVALEAAKFEQFGVGADTATVLVDEKARILGFVAKFDNELVRLKSGQRVTMRDLMEYTSRFKLAPEEAAFVEAAKTAQQSIHDWGIRTLEGHYMDQGMSRFEAQAKAAEIIRKAPLEPGQDYWPRMAAAVAEEDIALQRPNFFRVGAKAPNLQLPRTAEATGQVIRNSGDPGAVLSRYAQEVFYKVQHETVIKPMLNRFGIDPKRLIPTEMQAAVDGFRAQKDWIKRAQGLLNRARGLSTGQLRHQVSKLTAADVPEEWKVVVERLEVETLTGPQLARPTKAAAGEAARAFEPSRPTPRLEKAAEARIAAERAEAGGATLKSQIPVARAELKELARQAAENYNEAQRQLKAVQRVLQRGEGLVRLPEHKFPGITELFERSQAEAIEQAFDRLNPANVPRFAAAVNNWVGIGVGVQAGTADIGHVSLQMLGGWQANPLALPAMLLRMTNNKGYMAAITRLQRETFRDGRPMLQQMLGHDLRLVSEPLMPDVMTVRAGTVTGKVAKFVTNWPVNRTFTRGINLARMNAAKYGVKLTEALKRRPLTGDEYRQVMKVANTITGDFNWTRAGIGQTQRIAERVGVRFAPTWLRAMLTWVGMAAHPSMSVETNLARLALANTIGISVGIYSLVGLALGQKPNLDPMDVGKFMTYRVKDPITGSDVRIGPGGVLVQLTRTAGKAAILAHKAATAETAEEREGYIRDLVDIREGKNPVRQFWRAGAPVIGGLVYDMTAGEGVHSYTQRPLSPTPEGALGFAESALPFAVQPALPMIPGYPGTQPTEGVAGLLSTVLGGRSYPTSPSEIFIEMADEKARETGFRAWEEVPKATKADIMRKSPDLQAAQLEREKFFERFPSKQSREDFVFGEIDKSRTLTEDTLLAMWRGVEAGNRDVAEFRRAFSDLMGKHAYHASRLMDGTDMEMKRRKGETLQDYYARLYHAIQPEAFDGQATPGDFPDGQVSPAEWEMWRARRDGFWTEFAEAREFRSYIETEYPTRNWNSPEMAELHQTKIRMNQGYQEFLDIPKYRGLSTEAGNFIDEVRGLADRKSREVRFALAQRGIDPEKLGIKIPARLAWRLALEDIQQAGLSPEQAEWLKVAILMDLKSEFRRAMLSSERARYLLDHREMAQWYPSAYQDAGLGDREIALLGLAETPLGTSVPERLAAAV